jgi:hypothetical protein
MMSNNFSRKAKLSPIALGFFYHFVLIRHFFACLQARLAVMSRPTIGGHLGDLP